MKPSWLLIVPLMLTSSLESGRLAVSGAHSAQPHAIPVLTRAAPRASRTHPVRRRFCITRL